VALSWFAYLRMEAELAMTSIGTATVRADPENSARCRHKARLALTEIQRGIADPTARGLSKDQVVALESQRVEIEGALAKLI
jgi:hypothetical protein